MPRFTVLPGAEGMDMADGTHYDADRSGHVEVDDRHAAAIAASTAGTRGWAGQTPYTFAGGSKHCARCNFTAFLWQHECPRGHGPLTED